MGYNTMSIDMTYDQIKATGFPMDLTSDQMEGAIPDLTDFAGYDVELSLRFKNIGAPRFYFTENEMSVNFGLMIEFYDKDYEEMIMSIEFKDLNIDFNMYLKDFTILIDFHDISMGSAHAESSIVTNLDVSDADKHIVNYFNYAFMVIIPWANEYHPIWVSAFEIPKEIPGFMKIHDISMEIKENYLSFSMDPEFTIGTEPKVQSAHLTDGLLRQIFRYMF